MSTFHSASSVIRCNLHYQNRPDFEECFLFKSALELTQLWRYHLLQEYAFHMALHYQPLERGESLCFERMQHQYLFFHVACLFLLLLKHVLGLMCEKCCA